MEYLKKLRVLGLSSILLFWSNAYAADCKPVRRISDLELKIIEISSRQSAKNQLLNAESFCINEDGIVKVKFKDGAIKFFAHGNISSNIQQNNDLASTLKASVESTSINLEQPSQLQNNKETDYFRMKDELDKIRFNFQEKLDEYRLDTYGGRDLNLISPSELHYLGSLVDEALTILAAKPDMMVDSYVVSPVVSFAYMGNRYFNKMKSLLKENPSYDSITAYDVYISTAISDSDHFVSALRDDIPNDNDKKLAFKEFREIIEVVLKDRTIRIPETFNDYFVKEMKRLDPETYEFIKKKKIFRYFDLPD